MDLAAWFFAGASNCWRDWSGGDDSGDSGLVSGFAQAELESSELDFWAGVDGFVLDDGICGLVVLAGGWV